MPLSKEFYIDINDWDKHPGIGQGLSHVIETHRVGIGPKGTTIKSPKSVEEINRRNKAITSRPKMQNPKDARIGGKKNRVVGK